MCLNPKWIYKKGNYKEDNYRGKKGEFYELGTYSKCGSCEVCINEKMNNWVIRNYFEAKGHNRIGFITLTYAENPYIIVKKDFQDWLKRFRTTLDRTTQEKIRYFEADEYGTLNNRPHSHFLIYGWKENNPKYLGINKKNNLYYQSKIIEETWGLGRTSYQEYEQHEIPYLALYETPQETFKRAYKLNLDKVRKLENLAKNNLRIPKEQRENLYKELNEARTLLQEEKNQYVLIKERNSWSQALGWEEFYKYYEKQKTKCWTVYIEDKEFYIPSPWVKKLANLGDKEAAKEMFRREKLIQQSATENEEKLKNILRVQERKKREIIEWQTQKTELEDL